MVENRAFFRKIIFKSIANSAVRSFVIFISILLGSAVCAAFINIYADIDKKVTSELNSYGPNVIISPLSLENGYIKMADLDAKLSGIKELKAKNEYLFGSVNIGVTRAVIMGVSFSNLKEIMPFLDIKSGEFINIDFDDKNALIGEDLAKLTGVKVGDIIEISSPNSNEVYKVRIKGIVYDGQKEDSLLLISLSLAQEILDKPNLINYAEAAISGSYDSIKSLCSSLSTSEFKFEVISKVSKAQGQILDKIKLLMALIGVTILFITSVCINTSLSSILLSKIKEFALIRAIGASKRDVLKIIFSEILVISIAGSFLGALVGYLLAIFLGNLIFSSGVDFRFVSLVVSVILSLVFAFIASYYPVKKALNQNLADLLRE
ncbi:ABC transporter permease [Campylobacter fetus]|uniref:Integral membrane protein-permease component, involved in lipoprotein release n=2 Tax=Campylobacter fetus TaxID=196 RepID=A0RND5_CAMFF|nr:FtsX-like permease family protein [Campylobacter fetus]ABK83346.1 integral membrane protein-permease component, involved in lipoprotein release [Campylobacter fetus subsp. fetus 82-40]EAI3886966.1 ABC transporter permease [Campylobacter fetus]EAI3916394.1 ABC transporter permease [Campylobacter fetus]EAI3919793.1 ABC transporter permease [Campylobacter fetus]EAI8858678.1 ABC transporter permease [Campylobacter fetus]